jgi:hypothetical protein
MAQVQRLAVFGLAAAVAMLSFGARAQQAGDPGTLVQEKLASQIKLTKATADHTDIVTAGDIVELHKDGLMMCSSVSPYAYSNVYQNGALVATQKNRAKSMLKGFGMGALTGNTSVADAANNGCALA